MGQTSLRNSGKFSSICEHRDWKNADLVAAQEACHHKLNFSKLLPEVDRLLG